MIPDAAVEAAAARLAILYSDAGDQLTDQEWAREILEAAAPILLSHEREETRLAHVDAVVNAETADKLQTKLDRIEALCDEEETRQTAKAYITVDSIRAELGAA